LSIIISLYDRDIPDHFLRFRPAGEPHRQDPVTEFCPAICRLDCRRKFNRSTEPAESALKAPVRHSPLLCIFLLFPFDDQG
jgi:hypothetical protein